MTKLIFTIFILTICAVSVSAQLYVSPDAVKTTIIDSEDLKTLVKSSENEKPILINFWATWCGPCRVEFPDLVEIDKDYREKGLDFMIVSIDNLALVDTRVSDFLKVYKAEMPSYLLDLDSTETIKAVRQIAPRFSGTYPFTALYNAKGKLVYQKTGVIDPKILRQEIDKVLPKNNIQTAQNSLTETLTKNKEIQIQLTPYGYITLPKGYWAYMDYDMMDAWGGIIETLSGDFKIRFLDGLIVSVFDGEDKNIKWRKELKTENYSINYALSDNGKNKRILAKIKSANFSAEIKNDSEIEQFLEIISKYRTGRCESCFNSHNTKRMKKVFERLNSND